MHDEDNGSVGRNIDGEGAAVANVNAAAEIASVVCRWTAGIVRAEVGHWMDRLVNSAACRKRKSHASGGVAFIGELISIVGEGTAGHARVGFCAAQELFTPFCERRPVWVPLVLG